MLHLDSYLMFCRDRSRHGGGFSYLFMMIYKLHLSNFCDELLWLEICTSNGPVLFGVFYRPPTQGVDNLMDLNNCLLSIIRYPVVLCAW